MTEEHEIIQDFKLNIDIKNNAEISFKFAKDYYCK